MAKIYKLEIIKLMNKRKDEIRDIVRAYEYAIQSIVDDRDYRADPYDATIVYMAFCKQRMHIDYVAATPYFIEQFILWLDKYIEDLEVEDVWR